MKTTEAEIRLMMTASKMLEALEHILLHLKPEGTEQRVLYDGTLHPTDYDKTIVDYLEEIIKEAKGQ